MDDSQPYNPLDKEHLAESIVREFLRRPIHPLPPAASFSGAGLYALYYRGAFPLYDEIAKSFLHFERDGACLPVPIYIGKSDPPGSRKGSFGLEEKDASEMLARKTTHRRLFERLGQHAKSIKATNLQIEDFGCRFMRVEEIWVPLGEARLVEWFKPLWNVLIEGFGSKVEGGGRSDTARSVWDILHPGRKESLGLQVDPAVEAKIVAALRSATSSDELRLAIGAHRDAKRAFAKARSEARKSARGKL